MDPVIAALDVEASYLNWSDDGIFPSCSISTRYSDTLCFTCFLLLKASEAELQNAIRDLLPKLCEEESWAALGEKQEQIDRDEDAILEEISH